MTEINKKETKLVEYRSFSGGVYVSQHLPTSGTIQVALAGPGGAEQRFGIPVSSLSSLIACLVQAEKDAANEQ